MAVIGSWVTELLYHIVSSPFKMGAVVKLEIGVRRLLAHLPEVESEDTLVQELHDIVEEAAGRKIQKSDMRVLGNRLAQALTLGLRTEWVEPTPPPNAVRGLDGLKIADEVMKDYGATGIIIGGLAEEAWCGSNDPATYAGHKDVDVLVLNYDCDRHPGQWESGVDWWVSHAGNERPTNGRVGLFYNVQFKQQRYSVNPGIYMSPRSMIMASIRHEFALMGESFLPQDTLECQPGLNHYPIMPQQYFSFGKLDKNSSVADHCKPYRQ